MVCPFLTQQVPAMKNCSPPALTAFQVALGILSLLPTNARAYFCYTLALGHPMELKEG